MTVVPIFAPIMIPRLAKNEITPAFTSPTVITVVAVLDCTRDVKPAPNKVPFQVLEVIFLIIFSRPFLEILWTSLLKCSMLKMKRTTAASIAITTCVSTI